MNPNEVVTQYYFNKAKINPPIPQASISENASVLAYGDGAFSMINPLLRGLDSKFANVTKRTCERTGLTIQELKYYSLEAAKLIKAGLKKASPYIGYVFRGTSDYLSLEDVLQLRIGYVFKEKAFTSSSTSQVIANGFSNNQVLLKINSKTGANIGYNLGRSQEKEILFTSNTEFKVNDVEVLEKSKLSGKVRKVIVHLEEL